MGVPMDWWTRIRPTRIYEGRMHKSSLKRLNWEQIEKQRRQEGGSVVKGTSKRVIVVKSPDPKIFEQAIFIVKEDLRNREGGDVLREAQRVADEYIRGALAAPVKPRLHLPRWGWVLLSAAVLGFGGFAAHWLGLW